VSDDPTLPDLDAIPTQPPPPPPVPPVYERIRRQPRPPQPDAGASWGVLALLLLVQGLLVSSTLLAAVERPSVLVAGLGVAAVDLLLVVMLHSVGRGW